MILKTRCQRFAGFLIVSSCPSVEKASIYNQPEHTIKKNHKRQDQQDLDQRAHPIASACVFLVNLLKRKEDIHIKCDEW